MNLLVTGGCGFIGTNFVRLAVLRGHNVINIDVLSYAGRRENLDDLAPTNAYGFIHGDICDEDLVVRVMRQGWNGAPFDAIINFAAESHVDRSIYAARTFVTTNVLGVATLLEAARNAEIPMFVQISTDEVYGSIEGKGSFKVDSPLSPSSPYSASKASGDLLALSFFRTWGYDVRITRCTNNYGPYQYPEKFIPTIITSALRGNKIPLYGDGEHVRNWLFVEDHCEGIFRTLEQGKAGETYLFGGETEMENKKLIHEVLDVLAEESGGDVEQYLSLIEHVTDRPGHDRRYSLDAKASKKVLGWAPTTSFKVGLRATVRWYLGNRTWWENTGKG